VAHWIGLVNGFSNPPVSKINKVGIYIPNGSVKGEIYPWSYIYDQGSKGVKGAARVDCITLSTSVSLVGGLEEREGGLSIPGIGGFAGATEGRSSLFSGFFLSAAAFLSALALSSAFVCLGFRPAFFFGPAFFILVFQFAKEQLLSELVRLSKYLGPLPDGAPRTASILGSRYLLKYLSAEAVVATANPIRGWGPF
jgi:hypothetical protein